MNDAQIKKRIVGLMDLTSLGEEDTKETILALCQRAETPLGPVAAVCVYPQFVSQARAVLSDSTIKIATVANFPKGEDALAKVVSDVIRAIENGANEIDVVMPYQRYMKGDRTATKEMVSACKKACDSNVTLKVILETGALAHLETIMAASIDVIDAGADFIKTSTGKINTGATTFAARAMLTAIKNAEEKLGHCAGLKVAGGIRTQEEAMKYLALADEIMGPDWASVDTFRIGASSLLEALTGKL